MPNVVPDVEDGHDVGMEKAPGARLAAPLARRLVVESILEIDRDRAMMAGRGRDKGPIRSGRSARRCDNADGSAATSVWVGLAHSPSRRGSSPGLYRVDVCNNLA